jgi:hypothetical protein
VWRLGAVRVRECAPGHLDVGERAQDVDVCVGEHDARARGVLYSEFGLALLARNAPDGSRQVLSPQRLPERRPPARQRR